MVSRCRAHSLGDGPWSVRDFRSGLALRSEGGPPGSGGGGPDDAVDIVAARFSDKPNVMGRFVDRISEKEGGREEGAERGERTRECKDLDSTARNARKTLLKSATGPPPRMSLAQTLISNSSKRRSLRPRCVPQASDGTPSLPAPASPA
jgi:hypothetical protein